MKTNRILVLAFLAVALLGLAAPVGATFVTEEGACCLPDGKCEYMTECDCDAASGDFQGKGSLCPASGFCETTPVGGATVPLGVLGVVLPVLVLAVVVAVGAATTLVIKRRTA
jgi:hypothetical protein